MGKLQDIIISFDIFGHPVGVNYRGEDTFKTRFGAFCTLAVYILTVVNLTTLIKAYTNQSKLEKSTQASIFDPFTEPAFNFAEHQSEIFLLLQPRTSEGKPIVGKEVLTPDIGRVNLF